MKRKAPGSGSAMHSVCNWLNGIGRRYIVVVESDKRQLEREMGAIIIRKCQLIPLGVHVRSVRVGGSDA